MNALYDAVAERIGRGLTGDQIEAAIGQTSAGSPSDYFWSAWDNEVARIEEFFKSVAHEPIIQERMSPS